MKNILAFALLICQFQLSSQIVINEVILDGSPRVELKNLGHETIDVSSYRLCSFPAYTQLSAATIISGSTMLESGELLVVSGHPISATDDELGLYTSGDFTNPDDMIDYLEWGAAGGHPRSGVADAAGIWTSSDFIPGNTGAVSYEYDGVGEQSSDWALSSSNTSNAENSNTGSACDAGVFVIGNQTICGGDSHTFQVIMSGEGPWLFSYNLDDVPQPAVVATQPAHPLTLDQEGTYDFTMVSDVNCSGTAEGVISLTLVEPPSANISGSGLICSNGDSLEVSLTGNGPWNVEYNIDGAPQGTATLNQNPGYIPAPTEGVYVLTSVSDFNCSGAASGSVEVSFDVVDGGTIGFASGGGSEIVVCVDDQEDENVSLTIDGNDGDNNEFLVTDESGMILAVNTGDPINFEGSDAGTCMIWGISYSDGLTGNTAGNIVPDDLSGCYSLSNALTVIREAGIDCTTGIQESFIDDLHVFPNPFNDRLEIRFTALQAQDMRIVLCDAAGRVLEIINLNAGRNSQNVVLETSELASGYYLLSIEDKKGNRTSLPVVK